MTIPGEHQSMTDEAGQPDSGGLTTMDLMAAGLCVVWVGAVVAYVWRAPYDAQSLGLVLTLLIVFLPMALIWVALITMRSVRALRREATRLRATLEAMRAAYVQSQQAAAAQAAVKPRVERKLDELAASAKHTEAVLASFQSRRDTAMTEPSADRKAALVSPRPDPESEEQPGLALGTPAEDLRPPLSMSDFIKAMQFPESPDDKDSFRALRRALEDRTTARLIRAAQDVLTLLGQEGIYMDDLKPDRARSELWRRFAAGERGRAIAALGGIRDRSSLALTAGRMRDDIVFRDAGHHFLRTFDKTFAALEPNATDEELALLAETRTARAFMLFGRVTGTFD